MTSGDRKPTKSQQQLEGKYTSNQFSSHNAYTAIPVFIINYKLPKSLTGTLQEINL